MKVDTMHEKLLCARSVRWGCGKEEKSASDPPDYIDLPVDEMGMEHITDDHDRYADLEFEDLWRHSRRSNVLRHLRIDKFGHDVWSVSRTYRF